jgi:prepilin-type processing-associated H-X9-DG protein
MTRHTHRAFTILELIVVSVVVILATAVIIPKILQLRARMGEITCQNNLRQLSRSLEMYCLDRNGGMPFGIYFRGARPPTFAPPTGNFQDKDSWVSDLNHYFNTPPGKLSPVFQCPEAQQQGGAHAVSYVMNFIVAVTPYDEVRIGGEPPRAQTKPPSVHLMLREGTALIWDTPIKPDPFYPEGYITGADIDGQRFWLGAITPQFRYYSPHDPFGRIPPGTLGNNRPVQLNVGGNVYRNIDPPAGSAFPWQGNLRFRHNDDQTRCNVLFSDGSVRQFTAVVLADLTVQSHDALRRYFMINWPPGVPPNPSQPF